MKQADKQAVMDRLSGTGMVSPTLAKGRDELIDTGRDIPELVEYIGQQLRVGGEAIINAGQGLIEAKQKLQHGEWGTWLAEHFGLSARQAQRLMVIARNYGSNPTLASHLGQTKALALLALPESERENFLSEIHQVNGEEKAVIDMTSRELEKAIKERDEARKAAERAQTDTRAAEEARQSMEQRVESANELLDSAKLDLDQVRVRESALLEKLKKLRDTPVDVAVMKVDQTKLDAARAEGEAAKAEEIAQLQAQLDKAKDAKKKAEEKRKTAEAALADAQAKLEAAAKEDKKAAVSADPDVAKFEVYFNQAQEVANKLQGLLIKARGREDQTAAEKLSRAMNALGDKIKEAAK